MNALQTALAGIEIHRTLMERDAETRRLERERLVEVLDAAGQYQASAIVRASR